MKWFQFLVTMIANVTKDLRLIDDKKPPKYPIKPKVKTAQNLYAFHAVQPKIMSVILKLHAYEPKQITPKDVRTSDASKQKFYTMFSDLNMSYSELDLHELLNGSNESQKGRFLVFL